MTIKCEYCDRLLQGTEDICPGCGSALHKAFHAPDSVEKPPQSVTVDTPGTATKNKVAAGLLAILLGTFGIHKFYLGNSGAGMIMLFLTLLTCFQLAPIVGIIGLVEGIIYLTQSDRDFYLTYEVAKKSWF